MIAIVCEVLAIGEIIPGNLAVSETFENTDFSTKVANESFEADNSFPGIVAATELVPFVEECAGRVLVGK